jgi:hypothetical protein
MKYWEIIAKDYVISYAKERPVTRHRRDSEFQTRPAKFRDRSPFDNKAEKF